MKGTWVAETGVPPRVARRPETAGETMEPEADAVTGVAAEAAADCGTEGLLREER
jgi:hypothetical protein